MPMSRKGNDLFYTGRRLSRRDLACKSHQVKKGRNRRLEPQSWTLTRTDSFSLKDHRR